MSEWYLLQGNKLKRKKSIIVSYFDHNESIL